MGIARMIVLFLGEAVAANAESSAGVACFGAGGSLIGCFAGNTKVETCLVLIEVRIAVVCNVTVTVELSGNIKCTGGEGRLCPIGVGHNAFVGIGNNMDNKYAIGEPHGIGSQNIILVLFPLIVGNISAGNIIGIQIGVGNINTHRQLCEDIAACIDLIAVTGDGKHQVGVCINRVGCLKAIGCGHAFQFPLIEVVQVDLGGYTLNLTDIISDQVEVHHRAGGEKCIVGIRQLQSDITLFGVYRQFSGNTAYIALSIGNLYPNGVGAVRQGQVCQRDRSVQSANRTRNLYAVNRNLYRACVKSGIVRLCGILFCHCNQVDCVGGDRLTIHLRRLVGVFGNTEAGEIGILTVRNRFGIVHSDIIDVKGNFGHRVDIAGLVKGDHVDIVHINELTDIIVDIDPAFVLYTTIRKQRCERNRVVFRGAFCRSATQPESHHGVLHEVLIIRKVQPKTEIGCFGNIDGFREPNVKLLGPHGGGHAPVQVHSQSIFATVYLTGGGIYLIGITTIIAANGGTTGIDSTPSITII